MLLVVGTVPPARSMQYLGQIVGGPARWRELYKHRACGMSASATSVACFSLEAITAMAWHQSAVPLLSKHSTAGPVTKLKGEGIIVFFTKSVMIRVNLDSTLSVRHEVSCPAC